MSLALAAALNDVARKRMSIVIHPSEHGSYRAIILTNPGEKALTEPKPRGVSGAGVSLEQAVISAWRQL